MTVTNNSLQYYAEQQTSVQWKHFLAAMADEFSEQLAMDDLRSIMARVGGRFADGFKLAECDTLQQLQQQINRVWSDLDWGWVEFAEGSDLIGIQHLCSPLRAAFGEESGTWTPAFLEGAYQHWFASIGIDASLRVSQVGTVDESNHLTFQLSQV